MQTLSTQDVLRLQESPAKAMEICNVQILPGILFFFLNLKKKKKGSLDFKKKKKKSDILVLVSQEKGMEQNKPTVSNWTRVKCTLKGL